MTDKKKIQTVQADKSKFLFYLEVGSLAFVDLSELNIYMLSATYYTHQRL